MTLVLVFLLSAMVVTSSAQTRTVGVSEGDWFKYNESYDWVSENPNETMPDFEPIEWKMISIVDVSGTNITGQITTHYENGTEEIASGYVDIETGEGKGITMFIISANLEENDSIYTSDIYYLQKINETIIRAYPDSVRETNHLNITFEVSFKGFHSNTTANYYWDKSTGILVELLVESTYRTGDYRTNMTTLFMITESNIWVIPEFQVFLILPVFMITTLAAVVLRKRKQTPPFF